MRLAPADTLSIEELAELFNAGYEGYVFPFHVDATQLAERNEAWDIDQARSRVAFRGDEPIGLAMLALRGDRAWVGGLGVVPDERRGGVGRTLMEAVLAEAPGDVTLEVIEQNEAARRLYEQLGFEPVRMLEVWSLVADASEVGDVLEAEPSPAGEADPPWQRADVSLRPGYERLEIDGGALNLRRAGGRANVLQLRADDEDAARALLAAARARCDSLAFINVPEGHVASAALASLGARLDLRQFELRLTSRSTAPTG